MTPAAMFISRRTARRGLVAALTLAASACASAPQPQPTSAANAVRGVTVVTQWCSDCHAVRGVETSPDRAPPFEQVAARPGRDQAYLTAFLNADHFPMPTYRLLDTEKADVVAMIVSLHP